MPFRIRVSLAILLSLLSLLAIGPLITPVRPLQNTVSAESLADSDSQFLGLDTLKLHYKTAGSPGADVAFVLVHGFGSSLYTWHKLMPELATRGFVIAFDRPAFGLTERPLKGQWTGDSPYSQTAQLEQMRELMKALKLKQAVLVGHSSGGALITEFALRYPEQSLAMILLDPAIYITGGPPAWSRFLLQTPQMNRVGPLLMRQFAGEPGTNFLKAAWSKPEKLDDEALAAYQKPLSIDNWDKALWEFSKASQAPNFLKKLGEISIPALVLAGEDDSIVRPELSKRLADELANASFFSFSHCGHVPQEECPQDVMAAITPWLDKTLR